MHEVWGRDKASGIEMTPAASHLCPILLSKSLVPHVQFLSRGNECLIISYMGYSMSIVRCLSIKSLTLKHYDVVV
jgi:hypothetical protein